MGVAVCKNGFCACPRLRAGSDQETSGRTRDDTEEDLYEMDELFSRHGIKSNL